VTGGTYNFARGDHSSIGGGNDNEIVAGTFASSISGGDDNQIEGSLSTISGGMSNLITNNHSSVSGGVAWWLPGPYQWAAGDLSDDDNDQVHIFP
jgi:trimeric autotransporter adhesin